MNNAEAKQEAVKRWGSEGQAYSYAKGSKDVQLPYWVGRWEESLSRLIIIGRGDSFEAAFADADRRAALPETKEQK